jgi:hypothetical protein
MSLSSLDQTTSSGGYLETLKESKNPRARILETGRYPKLCCNHRLCPKRPLADEQSQMGKYRLARCLLFIAVSFVPLDLNLPWISRIAQYGPVCCVVVVCYESKKFLLVTVGKMEEGPPATTSRSSCQIAVSCVD